MKKAKQVENRIFLSVDIAWHIIDSAGPEKIPQ